MRAAADRAVTDPLEPLVLDLLEWIGPAGRPYDEVMDAWRTSCPRLPVWEEANARGFVDRVHAAGQAARVVLSAQGAEQVRTRLVHSPGPNATDPDHDDPVGQAPAA